MSANELKQEDRKIGTPPAGFRPQVVLTQFEWAAGQVQEWDRLSVDMRKGLILLLECQLDNLAECLRVEIRENEKENEGVVAP